MAWIFSIAAVLAAVVGLVKWTSWLTAKRHERFGRDDVETALKAFVARTSPCCCEDWVLFLSCPIGDTRLEAVRQECLRIVQESPTEFGPEAKAKVAEVLARLRRRA